MPKNKTPKRKPKKTVLSLDRAYKGMTAPRGSTVKIEFKELPNGQIEVVNRHAPPGPTGSFTVSLGRVDRRKLALFALRLVKRHGIEVDDS